jgi:hypothetical protein
LSHFGFEDKPVIDLAVGFWYLLNSVHPQTILLRDFSVGRRDLARSEALALSSK